MHKLFALLSLSVLMITTTAQAQLQHHIRQITDPAFNTLRYQYFTHSQRFMLETKILTAFKESRDHGSSRNIATSIHQAFNHSQAPLASTFNTTGLHAFNHSSHLYTMLLSE